VLLWCRFLQNHSDGKLAINLDSTLGMSTMNVSPPDELKSYVDNQVDGGGYGSTGEYVRDLIRRDRDRQQLRHALLAGASSSAAPTADAAYFESLRGRIRPNA
jgi:antitoxin ParD1/3/4